MSDLQDRIAAIIMSDVDKHLAAGTPWDGSKAAAGIVSIVEAQHQADLEAVLEAVAQVADDVGLWQSGGKSAEGIRALKDKLPEIVGKEMRMNTLDNKDRKKFRDMTPDEKGAMFLAWHEGKTIQCWGTSYQEWVSIPLYPLWHDSNIYRVKPSEPVVETFTPPTGFPHDCEEIFGGDKIKLLGVDDAGFYAALRYRNDEAFAVILSPTHLRNTKVEVVNDE